MSDHKTTILAVDDNPHNLKILEETLSKEGFTVLTSTNGTDALQIAEQQTPEAILLDIIMPEMDGIEVCRKLKEKPETKEIPVIFLSAKNHIEDIRKGFEAGGVDYIFKPFYLAELSARIKVQVSAHRRQQETISELEKTNEELTKSNELKNRFFSVIAHDLRSPIANISEAFKAHQSGEIHFNDELLKSIGRSANTTYELLETLLSWARCQQGRLELTPENIKISKMVEDTFLLYKATAERKHIELINEVSPDCMPQADYDTMLAVIRNLIGNAIKFTKFGTITVRSSEKKNKARIEIIDSGVGMPPEKVSRLFKIGEKNISTPGTSNEDGTGLGLILCQEFTTVNKGTISVESEQGKGTIFCIDLPLKAEATETEINPEYKNISIIIADNNYMNRALYKMVLEKEGFQLDLVNDGAELLQYALENSYDLIMMNTTLPSINGFEAARTLSELLPERPRMLLLTGYNQQHVYEKYDMNHFDGIIEKPLKTKILLKKMKELQIL